ncbi:MAG: hypothetical protein ACTSRU_06735, partial [Candidatus Hodarchaeales archaeon]
QELIVLLSPVIVILFPLGITKTIKKDILIIDSSTRTCKHNEERFTVSKKAAVTLKRVYSFSGSGSDNTPVIRWEIAIKDTESRYRVIYKHAGGYYSSPWIDETAEIIAEIMKIPIEDNTGVDKVIRYPGETDTPLVDILKKEGAVFNEVDITIPPELKDRLGLRPSNEGFELFTVHTPIDALSYLKLLVGLILVGLGVLIDYVLLFNGVPFVLESLSSSSSEIISTIEYLIFMMIILTVFLIVILFCNIFTLYFGKMLLTSLTRSTLIDFNKEVISLRDMGLFLTRPKGQIATKRVEKLILVNRWYDDYTVEFVGDNKRLQLPGNYNIEEAGLIHDLIIRIFINLF